MEDYKRQKQKLRDAGITYSMLANTHGCRACSVCLYLNGKAASKPLSDTIEKMLSGAISYLENKDRRRLEVSHEA